MATKKLGVKLKELLEKAGAKAEIVNSVLTAVGDAEIEEEEYNSINVNLISVTDADERITEKGKVAGRKEVWDFMDRNHAIYEKLLDDAAKEKYSKLGGSQEKNKFLLDYMQGRNVSNSDNQAFKKALEDYKEEVKTTMVEKAKYEEVVNKLTPAQVRAANAEIIKAAVRSGKIAQSLKEERHFERNFIGDFEDTLKAKKYTLDYESGEIKNSDGISVVGKNGEILTSTSFIDTIIEEIPDWQKKSDGNPAIVEIPVDGGKAEVISGSRARNYDKMNAE